MSEEESEGVEYEVEKIIGKRVNKNRKYYKVLWKGFPESEATWEPVKNLNGARDLIKEFERGEFKNLISRKRTEKRKSVIHAFKRDGKIFYTVVGKENKIQEISSDELKETNPQKIIDFFIDNISFDEKEIEEEDEENDDDEDVEEEEEE